MQQRSILKSHLIFIIITKAVLGIGGVEVKLWWVLKWTIGRKNKYTQEL